MSEGSSSKDDQEFSDASSRPETANQNGSESESDYKTGIEDSSEENGIQSGEGTSKSTANGPTETWETSSFIQNLLYEDSRAGVAVVDLFVAVKSAKNSIDELANLNDTVHERLLSLSHEAGLIQSKYENLIQRMTSFLDRVKTESGTQKSESEAVRTPSAESIRQPEVNIIKEKCPTEIGRFCSSCGFVKYLRENVTCPLCNGEIIVREKCSDCAAVERLEKRTEKKCESCRLSICQYCGLPELKIKKTNSSLLEEREKRTGSEENAMESCEQVQTPSPEKPDPKSSRLSPEAPRSGASIPSQTSSKVVESLFQFLVSHVFKSEEGSKSTTATRESLLSSLFTSKSGFVVSHEDSKKISEGTMSLSDSTFQLICEICGILGMIGPQGRQLETTSSASNKAPHLDEMEGDQGDKTIQSDHDKIQGHRLPTISDTRIKGGHKNSIITIYVPESLTSGHEDKKAEQPNHEQTGSRKTCQTEPPGTEENCDEEVFEEALSEPYMGGPSAIRRANCMGDLSKEATKMSKSVSTLTTTNDFVSSWIGKIVEDIKTKIKNFKSGSRQVSVTDQRTSEKVSRNLSTALEFTISANTPVGVFDITIRQYRDSRRKLKDGTFHDVVSTIISDSDNLVPVEKKTMRDSGQYWSDESLLISDSDHVDLTSCSEEEMEEFIEVYVQSRKKNISTFGFASKREKGLVTEMSFLHARPPFMEIVRCQPKTFIQEIVPKTEKSIVRMDGQQGKKKVTPTSEMEANMGSMLGPGKGSGGRRNDEEQGGSNGPSSPNSSVTMDRSFNDLVISIQIDVDDQEEAEERSRANNQIYIDLKVGGQDGQKNFKGKECVYLISKGEIAQLGEDAKNSLKDIWSEKDFRSLEDSGREVEKGRISFKETPIMIDKETENSTDDEDDQQEEVESKSYFSFDLDDGERKRIMIGKSVTFCDEFSEEEIQEVILDPELEAEPKAKTWARADTVFPIVKATQVEIHHLQQKRLDMITLDPRTPTLTLFLTRTGNELQKALDLIQDIETNVIKVKLSEAIMILPVLESELRKHIRDKMKGMTGKKTPSRETSLDNYFSALEVWPREEAMESSQSSEERFKHLLKLLSDLEEAVKSNEYSKEQICEHSSSRIYVLLHALTNNIRGLEEDATMGHLSETVDIASQLDTAVREFDDIIKKQPTDYVIPDKGLTESKPEDLIKGEPLVKEQLTNVRKKVFEMVEEDAIETEERIEMDFDRIDRLERENEESMKFVEAFLEKTLRRSTELTNLKTELKNLSLVLSDMYQELSKAKQRRERSAIRPMARSASPPTKEVPVRNTVSSLLLALDKLKTRAREKNEACKEILGTIASATSNKRLSLDRKRSSRSLRSSYTTKSAEGLVSSVKEFKRIGQRSLYLAWSKPEGALADFIIGYEILVNGKLNQKVRNPQRQQAVLYSVDLSQTAEVQLLGLIDNGAKVLLAIVTYLDL